MADTFFGFDTTINNGDHLLPPDDDDEDDCLDNEEEYDALNDETFGGLEDNLALDDDWEQQHEQFAEIAESNKHSDIENSINLLVLDDNEDDAINLTKNSSVWSYTPPNKNGDIFNTSAAILSNLQKASKSFIESHVDSSNKSNNNNISSKPTILPTTTLSSIQIPQTQQQQQQQFRTVEDLEKNLFKGNKQPQRPAPGNLHFLSGSHHHPTQLQPMFPAQHPIGRFPPGLSPMAIQQQMRHVSPMHQTTGAPLPPPRPPNLIPPGLLPPHLSHPHHRMLGHLQQQQQPPPPPHFLQQTRPGAGGFIYPNSGGGGNGPNNGQFPVNYPFNFPMQFLHQQQQQQQQQQTGHGQGQRINLQLLQQQQQQQQHQQQQNRSNNNNLQKTITNRNHNNNNNNNSRMNNRNGEIKDEYAGLMTNREKQWLLNIQLIQLNTGTPYFDDYYYTVFKERKAKSNKIENLKTPNNERNSNRYQNNRQQRNNDRQDNSSTTLTPRIYTPLQFENSLGKLQCGSVTAPRKIIDMDIVTPENSENQITIVKDSRKTKQLLLELELLYTLLLKAEDLKNPIAINNVEKLREIKQKQRLREIELAPTAEQKQEILKLFKQESIPIIENQSDYLLKILNNLLYDDKFNNFMNIRKGKMLLLRLLPNLTNDLYLIQLLELWQKLLLSLPIIGRRDQAGDQILPKLHPFFKRYIQSSTMSDICDLISGLTEVVRLENSRSTPLSHQGRCPLYFVLLNKFGVSALVILLIRTEYLLSSDKVTDKEKIKWTNFLINWSELTGIVNKIAIPIELIPKQIFNKHSNRFKNLTIDKKLLLDKQFVEQIN